MTSAIPLIIKDILDSVTSMRGFDQDSRDYARVKSAQIGEEACIYIELSSRQALDLPFWVCLKAFMAEAAITVYLVSRRLH